MLAPAPAVAPELYPPEAPIAVIVTEEFPEGTVHVKIEPV